VTGPPYAAAKASADASSGCAIERRDRDLDVLFIAWSLSWVRFSI